MDNALTDVYKRQPESRIPKLPNSTWPDSTSNVRVRIGTAYSHIMAGSDVYKRQALYRAFSLTDPDAVFTFLVPILRILCPIGQLSLIHI